MANVALILQESVPNLGEAGDLVRVKPGFARNYLVPQGKAIIATTSRVKQLEHQQRVVAEKAAKLLVDLNATRDKLAQVVLEIEAQAGDEGKLFGSVTAPQIVELLVERGFEVDRRRVQLSEPIKSVGEHTVKVKLHRDVAGEIKVVVKPSGAPAPEPEENDDDVEEAVFPPADRDGFDDEDDDE
ncbi:50S ribosomal protein L9 [Myxococcota bacterium]|nr:50S ribosomal protein L9 [Myxococcota bacterium]